MIINRGQVEFEHGIWYSMYQVGWLTKKWIATNRTEFWPSYMENENEGLLHYRLVRRYLKENKPVLAKWLDETKTSYGGSVGLPGEIITGWLQSIYPVHLLLDPGTIQETAFKLCFDVTAANQ